MTPWAKNQKKKIKVKNTPTEHVSAQYISSKNPASCLLRLKGQPVRALLDTGADICLLRHDIFEKLKLDRQLLEQSKLTLKNASGKEIRVLGKITLTFDLAGEQLTQVFHVSDQIKTTVILGRDFLCDNNIVIRMGENTFELNGKSIPLAHINEVTGLIRLTENLQIPPQHACGCYGRYHKDFDHSPGSNLMVLQADSGFIVQEPGLMIMNGMTKSTPNRLVPLTIVNTTNKHFSLRKGNVVAKIEALHDVELQEVTMDNIDEITDALVANNTVDKSSPETSLSTAGYTLLCNQLSASSDKLKTCHINSDQQEELSKLLAKNDDIFGKHEYDLGCTNLLKADIDTGDAPPIRKKLYRTPFSQRAEVKRQLQEMLKAKIISPSNSSWAAPIFCVRKKDGSLRLVCSYTALNSVIKTFYWPLPNIDDIFASLGGSRFISTLDFLKGYLQIPLTDRAKAKTAFVCEEGLFSFERLSFGLSTAPSIFQECMSKLLNGAGAYATSYLDDLIVHSKTFSEHISHLQDIFDRIRRANMKLQKTKCTFLREEVPYLGHIITRNGIKPDMGKIKAIQELDAPKTVKEVRAFVGMTSYYRRYIPHYAEIAEPLTQLTRKHVKFDWNKQRQDSFDQLKAALINPPVLAVPEFNKNFSLYCDSSSYSIGAVLTQTIDGQEKPVYYLSHQLSKTQRKWSTIERECFAIVFALDKFRIYLEGKKFPIYCDHNPLKFIHSADNKNPKLQRWAAKISAFGGKITYLRGSDNKQADFLSRIPGKIDHNQDSSASEDTCQIELINSDRLHHLKSDTHDSDSDSDIDLTNLPLNKPVNIGQHQRDDKNLGAIIENLTMKGHKSKFKDKYILLDGVLHYIDKDETLYLEIPKSLQKGIIENVHASCLQHLGRDKTYHMIKKQYHWKGLTTMVRDYVNQCVTCQSRNLQQPKTPLEEITPPRFCFQKIAIDTAGPYPETDQGNKYVITVIDCLSGYLEAFPVPSNSSVVVAKLLLNEIFRRYSWVETMVSDNGSNYVSELIQEILKQGHVAHIKTSPYHPQSNGKVERAHRTMVSCLAKVSNRVNWDDYVPHFCGAYNTSQGATSKYSPFYLLYHRDPILPLDTLLKPREKYYGEAYLPTALETMHKSYRIVRKRLQRSAQKNQDYFKTKHRVQDVVFAEGDPVYLKNNHRIDKFSDPWLPHYRVIKKTGNYTYIIQHQVTGKSRRAHATHLQLANLDNQWDIPQGRAKRKSRYVTSDSSSDDSLLSEDDSDIKSGNPDSDNQLPDRPETLEKVSDKDSGQNCLDTTSDHVGPSPDQAQTLNQKKSSEPPVSVQKPQRKAKLEAKTKMTHLREISSSNPPLPQSSSSPDMSHTVQQSVNQALQSFMHSFASSLMNSVKQTSSDT